MLGSSRTSRSPRPRYCPRRIESALRAARDHCSRAAANLFWVARYVERAEATLRIVRALVSRVSDSDEATTRVVVQICSLLQAWDAVPSDLPHVRPVLVASATLQGSDLEGALPYLVGAAQSAASVIRDRFSPDAWRALTDQIGRASCRER